VEQGRINVRYVSIHKIIADGLTKLLIIIKFIKFIQIINEERILNNRTFYNKKALFLFNRGNSQEGLKGILNKGALLAHSCSLYIVLFYIYRSLYKAI